MMTSQAMIGKTAITSAFSIVYVWPLELFPTALRSGAMGIQSFSSRVGAIIAPLVLLMGQPPSPVPYVTTLPPSPLSSALFFGQLEDTRCWVVPPSSPPSHTRRAKHPTSDSSRVGWKLHLCHFVLTTVGFIDGVVTVAKVHCIYVACYTCRHLDSTATRDEGSANARFFS